MASITTQLELEIIPSAQVQSVSNAHRWVDLGLILAVVFSGSILGSIYLAFHPSAPSYSNMRLITGICDEIIGLLLFLVLFKRQGRRLQDIGLSFRWTDLPKALGLVVVAVVAMWTMWFVVNYGWLLITLRFPQWPDTHAMFSTSSLWLFLPFLLLNPFFEEILVRGYLMTELIDLRKSVLLATVASIVVQTSYHLYYGVAGAVVVGSGLTVLAIYFAKSRRLMPVILAHMLWDSTALLGFLHR
jgi:membrane protease YdiL (CAAX protease family)